MDRISQTLLVDRLAFFSKTQRANRRFVLARSMGLRGFAGLSI
jgi:hypothetical protein